MARCDIKCRESGLSRKSTKTRRRAPVGTALTPTTGVKTPLAHRPSEPKSRRTRPTGGARSLSRRQARMPASGHGPSARGAHPRGMVAPLEEVCFRLEVRSAICVQRFDDSLNSAIHIKYRISLRSSSFSEPRYPPARVV